ncbi:MAG: sigma-70 family RNA polymerase sigma factor [Verrucomicrobiales bacterium]|nr:sigma-70 family RNA polymerase sigma factor [Verrucomicrobiales bacterium]
MPPEEEISESDRTGEFIALLSRHDYALTTYVFTLVPTPADAQDILQETKMALWRSFDSFEPGTNFFAWARKTALHRVLDYRKRIDREASRSIFSREFYERLSEAFEGGAEEITERNNRLHDCIADLSEPHRNILVQRYFRNSSIEDVAERVGRTVEATYRVLSRIRLALRKCLTNPSTAKLS